MPKFSVYTPTHDPRWLMECFESLKKQTVTDWEWVILENGTKPFKIPEEIVFHPQVRIRQSQLQGIGALKGEVVEACLGEIFVELDHDDWLASNCLEEIGKAHDAEPGGFYYSDCASVYPNGASETFGSEYGWEKYVAMIDGKEYMCQRSFAPTPRSLSEIWFAPNHVRAWSRRAYMATTGYDENLPVCDDHDLLCKTYLAGVPFVHINKPLYFYRRVVDPRLSNSYEKMSGQIRKLNYKNMNKYLHPMITEWCKREGLPMLDLGGAHNSPPSYIPVDLELSGSNIVSEMSRIRHDRIWPKQLGGEALNILQQLPDDSVGCIRAFDFIEHLPRDQMVPFMNEVYRVLAPDGFLISGTPSTDGRGAFQDPTHTNYINQNSFWYYTDRNFSKYLNGEVTCRFQAVRLWTEHPSEWHKIHDIPYVYADLLAIKGFKHVGPINI